MIINLLLNYKQYKGIIFYDFAIRSHQGAVDGYRVSLSLDKRSNSSTASESRHQRRTPEL